MEKLLNFLEGKKSIILGICSAVLSYLVASNSIEANVGALVQTILSLLAGGAVLATNDLRGANKLGWKK